MTHEDEPEVPTLDLDELTAHLDRGWNLVQRGDLARAEVSARHILDLEADSPEGHTLMGAIAAARGDIDEALSHYERATELDPEFVDPLLYAAELHLESARDLDQAIALCGQALDLADEEEQYLDALLLKAEILLQKGDATQARTTLGELPPSTTDLPEPVFHFRTGRLLLDLGEFESAESHLKKALERNESMTDALHTLALVYEQRGDLRAMAKTFLQVRQQDLKEPSPPWGVTAERFAELAEQALTELPSEIRTLLANVPIHTADYPALELVAEGNDPRMMGFFTGIPYPEKNLLGGAPPHLDRVFLYQRNVERYTRNSAELELEIRTTLLHETGHFFGLDEEQLEKMGLG